MLYWLRKLGMRAMMKVWSGPWFPEAYTMIHSVYAARALYVACVLEIADRLKLQPQTIAELSVATGTHERSLYRILRLLAAYKYFNEDSAGVFHLGPRGKQLLKDNPESARWWVISMGDELWASNSKVLESVKTGKTGFELAHGERIWTWYPKQAEAHDIFIRGMNGFTRVHAREVVQGFDFGKFKKVVDVGGGGGVLIGEVLRANPNVRGVLFDQPPTVAEAQPRISAAPWGDRCEAVGGNFFEKVPAGGDAYIFKHVLRDWDDASVVKMLSRVHEAMVDGGTLLVVDAVVDPRNGTQRLIKLLDVQIMLDGGGGLRTQAEFEWFFKRTGFELVKVHSTTIVDAMILEARKVKRPATVDQDSDETMRKIVDVDRVNRETVGAGQAH
jgi:hypothetical protein